MSNVVQVQDFARATFDASGTATAYLTAVAPWKHVTINNTAVSTTSTARTQCNTYRNNVAPANLIDSAPASGNGDSSDTSISLQAGDRLVCQWIGGDPGAVATVTITGQQVDAV